jgi:hypothetical protein
MTLKRSKVERMEASATVLDGLIMFTKRILSLSRGNLNGMVTG